MPYDDRILALKINGAQLKRMLKHVLRDENVIGEEGEFYQFSRDLRIVYDKKAKVIESIEFEDHPLWDDEVLTVGIQDYHYKNFSNFFNMPLTDLVDGKGAVVTASLQAVLEEFFDNAELPDAEIEGRLVVR